MTPKQKFPRRSPGRRKEDQVFNRTLNFLKLLSAIMFAFFLVYQSAKGYFIQEWIFWQSISPIVKR